MRAMQRQPEIEEDPIAVRNRANARHSTGPRTEVGRRASRGNAVKHGLCANPAAGVAEDPAAFESLHQALTDRFDPRDPLEDGLVHRIAVALWRLQRAARIDQAIGNQTAQRIDPAQARARVWMDRIYNEFHALTWEEVKDPELIAQLTGTRIVKKQKAFHRIVRSAPRYMDELRQDQIMPDGAGIMAMVCLIGQLRNNLRGHGPFGPIDAQLLSWLLGNNASMWCPKEDAEDQTGSFYPDERPYATTVDDLIGLARKRPADAPMPDELEQVIALRITGLTTQAQIAPTPYLQQSDTDARTCALLPDEATLQRLLRYESHAERSLARCLDQLARLRGVTVDRIHATITHEQPDGTTTRFSAERSHQRPRPG